MHTSKRSRKQRKDQSDSEHRQWLVRKMEEVGFVPGTRKAYLQAFDLFEKKLDCKTGATAKVRDARRYLSRPTVTIALSGIKFFYEKTLKRDWSLTGIPTPKREKKVPVVLSHKQVRAILSE